jgi:hypothetical protein
MSDKFEQYAIVELMGRQVIAGLVTEQNIGGNAFVCVDVPEAGGIKAFTKFFGPGSIYCITPCDQETAQAAVEGLRTKPINVYMLNLPSRSSVDVDDDEEASSSSPF